MAVFKAGRKVRQILDKNGWHLTVILNTHSTADHIGDNRYQQAQTGCRIYFGGIEAAFTRYPVQEALFPLRRLSLPGLGHVYSREATSQVAMLTWIFGDCREGQIPRSLLRQNFDALSACCGVFGFPQGTGSL